MVALLGKLFDFTAFGWQVFHDKVAQLLEQYPPNHRTEEGLPFWSGPATAATCYGICWRWFATHRLVLTWNDREDREYRSSSSVLKHLLLHWN